MGKPAWSEPAARESQIGDQQGLAHLGLAAWPPCATAPSSRNRSCGQRKFELTDQDAARRGDGKAGMVGAGREREPNWRPARTCPPWARRLAALRNSSLVEESILRAEEVRTDRSGRGEARGWESRHGRSRPRERAKLATSKDLPTLGSPPGRLAQQLPRRGID